MRRIGSRAVAVALVVGLSGTGDLVATPEHASAAAGVAPTVIEHMPSTGPDDPAPRYGGQPSVAELVAVSRALPPPVGTVYTDVVYDRSLVGRYTLDIYAPLPEEGTVRRREHTGGPALPAGAEVAAGQPAPVVVFFHGGSWIRGDKVTIRIIERFVDRMRARGWFVVSVNYTTPLVRGLRGPLAQATESVAWVRENAAAYGWDAERIGLYGVSAGGHIALMVAKTGGGAVRDAEPIEGIAWVLAECAPTDLVAMRDGDAFDASSLFRWFSAGRLSRLSPITYVDDATPPVLLYHGGADATVHIDQSRRYAQALTAAGGIAELHIWPDGNHAFLNLPDRTWFEQESIALAWMARAFAGGVGR